MARRGVAKGSAKGQNKYVSIEALRGCHIHQFLISGDCWAGRQSFMHGHDSLWQNHFYNQLFVLVIFFYEIPSIVCGLTVIFGQLQIAWHSKKSEKSTNAWWENLLFHVLHSFKRGEAVFYSTFEQCLMQRYLCFLKPSNKCCTWLFSSFFYSERWKRLFCTITMN